MKTNGFRGLLVFLVSIYSAPICFAADIMVIVDNPVNQRDVPAIEEVFAFLRGAVFSKSDNVGLVRAGDNPVLAFPPNGNNAFLETKVSSLLRQSSAAPNLAGAIGFAAEQLDLYHPESTEKRLFLLTAGTLSVVSVSRPKNVELFTFYVGGVPADFKNSLKGVSSYQFDIGSFQALSDAAAAYFSALNSGYKESRSYTRDAGSFTVTIKAGDLLHRVNEMAILLSNSPSAPVTNLAVNGKPFDGRTRNQMIDDADVFFQPVSSSYSVVRIYAPKGGAYTITFPQGGVRIVDIRMFQDAEWNQRNLGIAVGALLLAVVVLVMVMKARYRPVWKIEIRNNSGRICKVNLAKAPSRKAYGPNRSLKEIINKETPNVPCDSLLPYKIKIQGGAWKLLKEKATGDPVETIDDFTNTTSAPLDGSFRITIDSYSKD